MAPPFAETMIPIAECRLLPFHDAALWRPAANAKSAFFLLSAPVTMVMHINWAPPICEDGCSLIRVTTCQSHSPASLFILIN